MGCHRLRHKIVLNDAYNLCKSCPESTKGQDSDCKRPSVLKNKRDLRFQKYTWQRYYNTHKFVNIILNNCNCCLKRLL